MNQEQVFSYVYKYLPELVNGYVTLPDLSDYIVSPGLGNDAGIVGSLLLAKDALRSKNRQVI